MKYDTTHKIECFSSLPSTNDYAKAKRAEGKNLIVVARSQTGGRGTKGRSFSSREGGVYLTKLTFYEQFPASRAFEIMSQTAAAVCKTLQAFGVTPKIKWPNDIYVSDKKICGILIENTFSGGFVSASVVGVGINVWNELEPQLQHIATSLLQETGEKICVEEVTETLIQQLLSSHTMNEYLSFVGYMGSMADILQGESRTQGKLLRVDCDGALWVEMQGEEKRFTSAEISVRI